jgi:hypothetical protein
MMIAICVLLVVNLCVTVLASAILRFRLILVQDDVSAIRIRTVPPNIGGRIPPSFAELQTAKNRMDPTGVAHAGGPG